MQRLPTWLHIQKQRFFGPFSWAFIILLVTPVHRWDDQIAVAPVLTRNAWRGYAAAVVGIVITSFVIVGLNQISHVENISLIYLLIVLWLALTYGRGPSIVAAVLAIVAYDFFSIPPVYFFGVFNSSQGIAIIVLFSVALVVGQLIVALREREQLARESQHQTAILYTLAQDLATEMAPAHLFPFLARRTIDIFMPFGITACALFIPDDNGPLRLQAAHSAAGNDMMTDFVQHVPDVEQAMLVWRTQLATPRSHQQQASWSLTQGNMCFVPFVSNAQIVGAIGIASTPSQCAAIVATKIGRGLDHSAATLSPSRLFAAYCDQIAVALDRAALHQQAIQVTALREADRLKTALLGSVTHDLRTPIAAIQMTLSSLLLPEMAEDESSRAEVLRLGLLSTERLRRLVDNLLTLSRLEAGGAAPQKTWILVEDLIVTVLAQLEQAGRTQAHRIVHNVPNSMLQVPMDHAQIERVLINLVENAVKYSPPGSLITIEAQQLRELDTVEVRVIDHGIGVPAAKAMAIFDKFYRLQRSLPWEANQPALGTGLGLAICAGIIHEHGGRIWVEATAHGGATLAFTLPMTPPEPLHAEVREGCDGFAE